MKITTMTLAEWEEEGELRFGQDRSNWKFVCPSCGNIASAREWRAAKAADSAIGTVCIGRFTGSKKEIGDQTGGPCNYGTTKKNNLCPVRVLDDGESRSAFNFAPKEE